MLERPDDTAPRGSPTPGDDLPLLDAARAWLDELPGLFSDRVLLLSLELRRSTDALGRLLALALAAAVLFGTAWMALWAGLAAALIGLGLAWPWAMLLVLAANVAAALWTMKKLRALTPRIGLPATVRCMTELGQREAHDQDRSAGH